MKRKSRKRRARTISMRRVKSRSGYSFAPMGKSTRRRSSGSSSKAGISTAMSAATATSIFWLLEAAFQYGAKALNITTPKSRLVIPGLIALLAYKKKIDVPGLLPIAISQLMNTARQTSPALNSMFTFDGYGNRPRTYAETVAAIQSSTPNPMARYQGLVQAPMPGYSGLQQGPMPRFNGYNQPFNG